MADLPWIPVHMVNIVKFNLWCVCDICEQRICQSDTECCQSTSFIPMYTMTMKVRGPRGEFTVLSKELSVLRALLYMYRDTEWNHWITAFRLMKMFTYDTTVDVFKDEPATDKILAMKQCLSAILVQYGQRPHFLDMKFRALKSNMDKDTSYYCMLVRPTEEH